MRISVPLPDFIPWGSGYKSVYYGVNQANIRRDTAIQKLKRLTKKCMERRTNRPSRPAFHTFLSKILSS